MLFISSDSPAPASITTTTSRRSPAPATRVMRSPICSVTPARCSPSARMKIARMVITAERLKPEKVSSAVSTPVAPNATAANSAITSGRSRSLSMAPTVPARMARVRTRSRSMARAAAA